MLRRAKEHVIRRFGRLFGMVCGIVDRLFDLRIRRGHCEEEMGPTRAKEQRSVRMIKAVC
jgi:hypothetical protein